MIDWLLRVPSLDMKGEQIRTVCPRCRKEEHLFIHRRRCLYICFRCGNRGTFLVEALRRRSEWRKIVGRAGKERRTVSRVLDVPWGDFAPLVGPDAPEGKGWPRERAIRYLESRGVSTGTAQSYGVCVRRWNPRVWFPYWEADEVLWAVGRSFNGSEPKTMEVGTTEKPLFGRHLGPSPKSVVLVEGVFDHLHVPESFAVMGSTVTSRQILSLVADGVERAFLLFDPDAEDKVKASAEHLRRFGVPTWPVFWRGTRKDPAEIGRVRMGNVVRSMLRDAPVRPQALTLRL